ncbi:hypothetical protein Rxycam_00281 [Rubrobacter xylanophilus DSM 9941]|uniref:hypothetical protein n=1 Tax=Rubrobacter xylanophilus TaxID=49319 RepID=UPI001C63CE23|nr:hypothetical protein [Rubrobacter xylanophilus]QYJ14485.1 hypothetical protein Rxycam_00281 [Rubrobacter xylanophilus DSM 9941]
MLRDLIVTLCVALPLALLPGYPWARVLCGEGERAVRLVFGLAFSLATVPAAVLAAARLSGAGVTVAAALLGSGAVLLSGVAVSLVFGPARPVDKPLLALPPAPLGLAVLLPLGGALLIGFGVASGAVSGGWWPPVLAALLAGAAGVLGLTRPGGGAELPEPPGDPAGGSALRRLALPASLLPVLLWGYSGPVLHDWPFIRGVDHYSHTVMANLMMERAEIYPYLIYPPGFHALTAAVCRLGGLDPLELFPVLAPAFLLLPALALYVLGRILWGGELGVLAATSPVLLGGTYYYFQDAMYPNMVTAQFLLPMALAALLRLYTAPGPRTALLAAVLGSSVVLYHQVSAMYLGLLLGMLCVWALPHLLLRERKAGGWMLLSLALLGSLSVLYAWDTYDLPGLFRGLLSGSPGGADTGEAVEMALGTQTPYSFSFLSGTMVSLPVLCLGLFGVVLAAGGMARRAGGRLSYLTLVLWAFVLLVGSRTAMSGFPQRFGRDLGLPLALFAVLGLVVVLRSLVPRRLFAVFVTSAVALLAVGLVGVRGVQSLQYASGPSVQLTMTPGIAAAGEWLERHNTGGNIMVSPHANQVPSRMMLAMGDYSALQSFTRKQILRPRDLPPGGARPLLDVLRVVEDPAGGEVPGILRRYDVRYIVLYKNMPDRPTRDYWRAFVGHPDLYRPRFENRDVLIVEPRNLGRRDASEDG